LSLKYKRNILVGDNDDSRKMDFDRNKVQLICIPKVDRIIILKTNLTFGTHQCIVYENEFVVLKNNTQLFVNNILIKSLYEEKHKIKFVFNEYNIGLNIFKFIVNQKEKESGEFYVD
jgi:hypothetical protein